MSGFVSIGSGGGTPADGTVTLDEWWPDIDLGQVREEMRIDGTVTGPRLRLAVCAAILTVNNDLAAWRADQEAKGHASLADVPAPRVDGQSALVFAWRRAVLCQAKASLVERYRDFDATGAGQGRADDMEPTITELRRDAMHAVRDILGARRTTVELI